MRQTTMDARPDKGNSTSLCDFMLTSARSLGLGELACYRLDRLIEQRAILSETSHDEEDCCCRAA
jgi:hypothetical protein